jgi:hypothetical protein
VNEGLIIEAVVQVGAAETRYLRCGRGTRVVVVLASTAAERAALMARFGAEYRVIAPLPAAVPALSAMAAPDIEQWLRGVIDGLGLERPTVALAPDLAWLAERLVSHCGDALDTVLSAAHPPG